MTLRTLRAAVLRDEGYVGVMIMASDVIYKADKVHPAAPNLLPPDKRSKRIYEKRVDAFDIEAYSFESPEFGKQAAMYQWQYQTGLGCCYIGRTWAEFVDFMRVYSSLYDVHSYIVTYVHNLSYEFQFLKSIVTVDDVFARDRRSIIKFTSGRFEFRCSYIHSNMSLDLFTRKYGAPHGKLVGEIDYNKEFWFDTPLDASRISYGANDVKGLVEAIMIEMEGDGDDNATIPLTSTGYVRREAREALRRTPIFYRPGWKPSYRIYRLCRQAFRGGDTHANRYYAGKILSNVKSADRSSSYLDSLTMRKYPVGDWMEEELSLRRLNQLIEHNRPFLMRAVFSNIRLKYPLWGCPYIPLDKVRGCRDYVNDNGRIISASILEMTITDIDFDIIQREYDFDYCDIRDLYSSKYQYLPPAYVELVQRYYLRKTELKGVQGSEVYYNKMKNRANSMYGLTAQNPVRDEYKFLGNQIVQVVAIEAQIYDKVKPMLPYAWGVWCTAHARYALHEAILAAGDGFVYCDTDSVKYIGECDLSSYNTTTREIAMERGSYAIDSMGAIHYMGVYEDDGKYDRFVTWGAKKYAYESNGKLHITIAGVNKSIGAQELDAAGGLEKLRPGYTFKAAAGLEAAYNDQLEPLEYIRHDGVKVLLSSNVALSPSTYTLGLSLEYEMLLSQYSTEVVKDNIYNDIMNNHVDLSADM